MDLTKIELQDGLLCLYQNQRHITARSKRGLFPGHLTADIEYIRRRLLRIINAQPLWRYYDISGGSLEMDGQ